MQDLDDDYDYADPNLIDYQGRLAHLRDTKGVARLRLGTRAGFMLLRFNDVRNGFMDSRRFSKSLALRPATFPTIGPNLMGYDGDEHRIKRGLVAAAFLPRAIRSAIESLLRPVAEELVDQIAPRGSTNLMISLYSPRAQFLAAAAAIHRSAFNQRPWWMRVVSPCSHAIRPK
jgi:cytochrome P450